MFPSTCVEYGLIEKLVLPRRYYVGTGLVPVLTSMRTATRAVPTITPFFQSNAIRHFFNSPIFYAILFTKPHPLSLRLHLVERGDGGEVEDGSNVAARFIGLSEKDNSQVIGLRTLKKSNRKAFAGVSRLWRDLKLLEGQKGLIWFT